MATAWLLALPAAALVAGAFYFFTEQIGTEIAGPLVVSILDLLTAAALFVQAQRSSPVTAADV